jgi:hypothetical protein
MKTMKAVFMLAMCATIFPACLANVTRVNVPQPTSRSGEHQPSANYYAVSHPAYAWGNGVIHETSQYAQGSVVDKSELSALPVKVPADAHMQIMDENKADFGHSPCNSPPTINWFAGSNATFNSKSFIHKTRCYAGNSGTIRHASTGTGATYKFCNLKGYSDDYCGLMDIGNTFQVAPFLCEETCDKDEACVGYVIDGAGDHCWVLHNSGGQGPIQVYYRISD